MKASKTLLARTLKSFARTAPKPKKTRKRRSDHLIVDAMKEAAKLNKVAREVTPMKRAGRPRTIPAKPQPVALSRGERHPSSKLADKDRRRIIRAYDKGKTQTALAAEYAVTQSAISHVVRNQRWLVGEA